MKQLDVKRIKNYRYTDKGKIDDSIFNGGGGSGSDPETMTNAEILDFKLKDLKKRVEFAFSEEGIRRLNQYPNNIFDRYYNAVAPVSLPFSLGKKDALIPGDDEYGIITITLNPFIFGEYITSNTIDSYIEKMIEIFNCFPSLEELSNIESLGINEHMVSAHLSKFDVCMDMDMEKYGDDDIPGLIEDLRAINIEDPEETIDVAKKQFRSIIYLHNCGIYTDDNTEIEIVSVNGDCATFYGGEPTDIAYNNTLASLSENTGDGPAFIFEIHDGICLKLIRYFQSLFDIIEQKGYSLYLEAGGY